MGLKTKKILKAGRYLRLVREGSWEYVERVNCRGVVVVMAVTPDQRILLNEQFRTPVHRPVIEFPAGLIGDTFGKRKESFAQAARRELWEETGYVARKIKKVFFGPASAGLTSDLVTIVQAHVVKKTGIGGGLPEEAIKVHEVFLKDLNQWLHTKHRQGFLVDPKVYLGLFYFQRVSVHEEINA